MKILQAYTFQLCPKGDQASTMRQFAGCCRFVWNRALALEKEIFASEGKRLGYNQLTKLLVVWKHEEETSFLRQAHSQILQQSLKNLDQAYKNFFATRAESPRFKETWRS